MAKHRAVSDVVRKIRKAFCRKNTARSELQESRKEIERLRKTEKTLLAEMEHLRKGWLSEERMHKELQESIRNAGMTTQYALGKLKIFPSSLDHPWIRAEQECGEISDLAFDALIQGCEASMCDDGSFVVNTMSLSSYEDLAEFFVKKGWLKPISPGKFVVTKKQVRDPDPA